MIKMTNDLWSTLTIDGHNFSNTYCYEGATKNVAADILRGVSEYRKTGHSKIRFKGDVVDYSLILDKKGCSITVFPTTVFKLTTGADEIAETLTNDIAENMNKWASYCVEPNSRDFIEQTDNRFFEIARAMRKLKS